MRTQLKYPLIRERMELTADGTGTHQAAETALHYPQTHSPCMTCTPDVCGRLAYVPNM